MKKKEIVYYLAVTVVCTVVLTIAKKIIPHDAAGMVTGILMAELLRESKS